MNPRWSLRTNSTDDIVVREIWDENVYHVARDELRAGDTVLDIGANIGAFSLYAVHCGAGRVVAFEPERDNYAALRANLDANPEARGVVTAVRAALWREEGVVTIRGRHGSAWTDPAVDDSGASVRSTTLERVFEEHGIDQCAILKLDVEGAEYPIFEAASVAVIDRCARIVMEFHAAPDDVFGRMLAKLTRTHKLQTLGSVERGGYVWAERY